MRAKQDYPELEQGVRALERHTPPQGSALRAWLAGMREAFAGRILPCGERTAEICAALHVPNPRGEHDAMIGATVIENGFTLVTRDVDSFAGMGALTRRRAENGG